MANYLSILVWRRLPSELTSPVKWSPRAEGPSLCSISQRLHLAHKKPEYEYGFIQHLVIKKIASKSPVYSRLTPCFCRHFAMFGDSSQVRAWCSIVQMYGWNIMQRAASHCDVIMGSVKSSMHSHDTTKQTSVPLVTDALTMQLNVVKAITESSAVSLCFWRKPSDTDMQTT